MGLLDPILSDTNLIAFLALITSIVAILIGFWGLWLQRKHNRLSVKPFLAFHYELDLVNKVMEVQAKNAGSGPLILQKIEVMNKEGIRKYGFREWLPKGTLCYTIDFEDITPTPLSPGSCIFIFKYNATDGNENDCHFEEIRTTIDGMTVIGEYTDIYNTKYEISSILDWNCS